MKNEQLVALKLIFLAISPLLLKLCELISYFEKHRDEVHKEDDRKMSAELVADHNDRIGRFLKTQR